MGYHATDCGTNSDLGSIFIYGDVFMPFIDRLNSNGLIHSIIFLEEIKQVYPFVIDSGSTRFQTHAFQISSRDVTLFNNIMESNSSSLFQCRGTLTSVDSNAFDTLYDPSSGICIIGYLIIILNIVAFFTTLHMLFNVIKKDKEKKNFLLLIVILTIELVSVIFRLLFFIPIHFIYFPMLFFLPFVMLVGNSFAVLSYWNEALMISRAIFDRNFNITAKLISNTKFVGFIVMFAFGTNFVLLMIYGLSDARMIQGTDGVKIVLELIGIALCVFIVIYTLIVSYVVFME
jgi:hypothetical protein